MGAFALKFIAGRYKGGEFVINDGDEIYVGRAAELDIVLVEDMVSRKHVKITCEGKELEISDLGSTNGTFVNGEKISHTDLDENDRILIGTTIIKVLPHEKVSSIAPGSVRELLRAAGAQDEDATSLSGDLIEIPLADLLQLFAANRKTGILTLYDGPNQSSGKVVVNEGTLEYAAIETEAAITSLKAIARMVAWKEGSFRLDDYQTPETIDSELATPAESIVIDALRLSDEINLILPDIPPLDSALTLCIPLMPLLKELNEKETDVLQLSINFDSIQAVIDKIPFSDAEALRIINKLLLNGYLEED
ncbi:FHA domain-containing protein [Myxococcota bacterium]|nr:FHA domain-containing protein [Myxococcota bacterium]